jgi:hypothetical protein
VNERCGCGAAIEHVEDIELIREWRDKHRHEAPPLKASPAGGNATTERAWSPTGFAIPEQTDAM